MKRRFHLLLSLLTALAASSTAHAQSSLPPLPNITRRIPVRMVEALTCNPKSPSCNPTEDLDLIRADLDRANTFWRYAGIEFWIRSLEYAQMPNLNASVPNTTTFTWAQVKSELRAVFPSMPANAFPDAHQKAGNHWWLTANTYYGDPNEIFVVLATSGQSKASFPWAGRAAFVSVGNIPATTMGHEFGHYLGLTHNHDDPPLSPIPGHAYTKCDRWDLVYKPGATPQFFSGPNAPGCNDADVALLAPAIDLRASASNAMASFYVGSKQFFPGDSEIKGLFAGTGDTHAPPVWGYSANLMGGYDTEIGVGSSGATIDGATPRFIPASQIRMLEDFLTHDMDYTSDYSQYFVNDSGNDPVGANPNGLNSQRTKLGKDTRDFMQWSNGAMMDEVSFAATTLDAGSADATVVAGDFNGDGFEDLAIYRPLTGVVKFWWFAADRSHTETTQTYSTNRTLFSGDFDGNGCADLFLYGRGSASDTIVYGRPTGGGLQVSATVSASDYEPFAADFEGDGDDDIFWYVPTAGVSDIWWGNGSTQPPTTIGTTFTVESNRAIGLGHRYTPVVGNFDGAAGDDILWYAAGAENDLLWRSQGTRIPTTSTQVINGFYRPVAGDFDGDGNDDILWDHATETRAPVWRGVSNSASFALGAESSMPGFQQGISGDFDGDGAADIYWYKTKPQNWVDNFHYDGAWRVDEHPRMLADVNNDGRMDMIGFGIFGTEVALSTGFGFSGPSRWLEAFHTGDGWEVGKHPRLMADVDGDGRADVIGFANNGTEVAKSLGNDFTTPSSWVANFHYNGGWRVDRHPRMAADVNGDGKADIVGFGNSGVVVATSNGSTFSAATNWLSEYNYNAGWRVELHPRLMGDVDGDGDDDIVAFGNSGTYVSKSTGTSFTSAQNWLVNFHVNGGWEVEKHPRFLADMNGDGKADVVGFGNDGVVVAISTGSSFSTAQLWSTSFGYDAGGWRVEEHPRMLADVNGDGLADVIGFGNTGAYVAFSTGGGLSSTVPWIDNYGYDASGWRVESHPRFVTDVDGDGRADLVGCGNSATLVVPSHFSFAP